LAGGLLGTGVELLLLEHTEDLLQWIPLGLIALSLLALLWERIAGSGASLLVFRGLSLLSVASGALGVWLHYRGNVEFEIESVPGLEGFELFRAAMGGATPALAPGTMILLGVLGLLSTMGRPRPGDSTPSTEEL
jgi:hypothetical protein